MSCARRPPRSCAHYKTAESLFRLSQLWVSIHLQGSEFRAPVTSIGLQRKLGLTGHHSVQGWTEVNSLLCV